MGLQLSQLSSPFTTIYAVCAVNAKLVEGASHALIYFGFKFLFPAPWARTVIPLNSLTACVAEAVGTTFSFIWITKYQATYWACSLIYTWRRFDKFAIITSRGSSTRKGLYMKPLGNPSRGSLLTNCHHLWCITVSHCL